MRRTSRLAVILWAFALMVSWCAGAARAQESPLRAQLQSKFDTALRAYNEGRYEDAAKALDSVLEQQPTAREALLLREKAGIDLLVKMLRDPQMGPAARKLLQAAEKEAATIQRDPETILAIIEEMKAEDIVQHWAAIQKIVAVGPYAVPYLLDYALSDGAPELGSPKVNATIALQRMGSAAVPPLAVAMYYTNSNDAERIAAILSKTPDARAVPYLLALIQEEGRAESLKRAAAQTLQGILPGGGDAAQAFYEMAERYYYSDPTLVELAPMSERVLWRWNAEGEKYADKLVYQNVPAGIYPRLRAQELLLLGMKQTNASEDILELYASNNYMQLIEATADETLADRAEGLKQVHAVNESLGANILYRSLDRALRDKNTLLARLDVEAIRKIGDSRPPEINSLVTALSYPDKVVRVSAAETLMHLSPVGQLGGADQAATVIAAGLGAPIRQRIVILSQEEGLWRRFSEALAAAGMVPLGYKDLTETAQRVKDGVPPTSALIIDTRVDGALVLAKSINADARSTRIPVVLAGLPGDVERLRGELGNGIAAVIAVNAEASQVAETVSSAALAAPSAAAEDIREDVEMVRRILTTLRELPPITAYPVAGLSRLTSDLLAGMKDDIRLLALQVIANLPDASLRDPVFRIFADEKETAEIRANAGKAFLKSLTIAPELTPEQKEILLKLSAEASDDIRFMAIHALSIANLPQADRQSRLPELGLPPQQ